MSVKTRSTRSVRKRGKSRLNPDSHHSEAEAAALARQAVLNAAPAITAAIIEEAKAGSYLHARMLFDFIGFTAAQPQGEGSQLSPMLQLIASELEMELPAAASA